MKNALIADINTKFPSLSLEERVSYILNLNQPAVFTSSFGLEDQVLTHFTVNKLTIITLDTGRLFNETYDLWAQTENRYQTKIKSVSPEAIPLQAFVETNGINGLYQSQDIRKACCFVRKVEPLKRALAGHDLWLTGLRADQSPARSTINFAQDDALGLIKINPLLDFTRDQLVELTKTHKIPVSSLYEKGYLSIGCAPCTRALREGEHERAGRWYWEEETKKECGLHVAEKNNVAS
jgi:phosphoadenosine phosphosulfate reductase